MSRNRDKTISGSADAAQQRTRTESEEKKRKREQRLKREAPSRLLEERWIERMIMRFGLKRGDVAAWAVFERTLATKLLREGDHELATKMVESFIGSWDRAGVPRFRDLWNDRGSVRATVLGLAKTGVEARHGDEFDRTKPRTSPKLGW